MMRARAVVVATVVASVVPAGCKRDAKPAPILEELNIDLHEGSGIVVLGDGRFLIADDEEGVQIVDKEGVRLLVPVPDLEGIARVGPSGGDPAGERFIAIEEQGGVVWSFDIAGTTTQMGYLVHPPSAQVAKASRGWEGIALLPAALASDKKDHLIAVHEGSPKAIAMFEWPSLEPERTYVPSPLPDPTVDRTLDDLSDVAIDPTTGDLLLLSDKSRRIVRVKLGLTDPLTVSIVSSTELPVEPKEKPEGIGFDGKGGLWVVTDATGRIFKIAAP